MLRTNRVLSGLARQTLKAHRCYASDSSSDAAIVKPLVLEHDPKYEVMEIGGIPEAHQRKRLARIFQPARNAMQSGWDKTGVWKIELDNRERWENQNMGWCSSGDPLSNISMALSFASVEDAIHFCEKNKWNFEVDEPQVRKIVPKSYGSNFSWDKRTRVSTK